ncbi:MAG: glycosyltransferase family 39 protein, partial [Anaerolineae bacterium]|nr:glycosyltransferase family 39 protein [Anaerolineae bacterium]
MYHFPGSEPSTPFPFGFPLLLTPLIRLFPTNPGILKIESLIAILLSTSLLFWAWPLLSRVKSYWWGLAVGAQFALSPGMVTYSRAVVSEPAFIMWVLIALVLVEQCVRREKVSWLRAVLLGIATVMAVFTRTIGIALVLAVLVRLIFLQPRRRIIRNLIGVSVGAMGFLGFVLVLTPVRVPDLIPNRYVSSYDTNVEQFIGTQTTAIGSEVHPGFAARTLQTILLYTQTPIRQTMLPVGGGETEAAFGQRFGIPDLPVLSNAIICGLIVIGMLAFLVYKGLSPGVLMY